MDVVIPLSEHTNNDFLDLRYTLRGFEIYLRPTSICLIGAKPGWIKNVQHIPAKDNPDSAMRERNMFEKLLLYPGEEFIYANDDHFLLQNWQEQYAWDMTLVQKYHSYPHGSMYKRTIANTLRVAPAAMYYDTHCPMLMHQRYLLNLKKVRWDEMYGYCLKTLYAQSAKLTGVQYADMKLREPFALQQVKGRRWFSAADGVVEKSLPVMNKLYSKKSKWEA